MGGKGRELYLNNHKIRGKKAAGKNKRNTVCQHLGARPEYHLPGYPLTVG